MYETILTAAVCLVVLFFPVSEENKSKVLILGAGLSGITAAKTLLENNITDFLIIEGKNYTGGRIHAVPFGELMVEVGANWIQYTEEDDTEPLLKRKNDRNMNGIWTNYSDFLIRDETGKDVTGSKYVQKYDEDVNERLEEFVEARKSRGDANIPARVGLQLMGWRNDKPIEKVLEYYNIDFEYAKPPELVSLYGLSTSGTDFFVSDPRGLWSMFEDLYQPLTNHIRLNKIVNKIKYSDTSVEVHTSDGQVFTSDYALCTFSSGVLVSDMVSFEPPLPEDKKEAIFKKPLAVYTIIFLKFPRKFWDDHEFILYASRQRGRWPVFQDLDRPGILLNGNAVLSITVTEDEGRRVEGQAFNETQAEIMKTLREIYGESIPDPTAIYYHRWSQDPLILGAFSDPVLGFSSEDNEKLGENLGRLYFSGEATSEEWYGYQQGAYLTGKEKGEMIADEVLGRTSKKKNQAPWERSSCSVLLLIACILLSGGNLLV